jgi:drug/metabolite transporter (DMT)-like permease
LRCDETVGNTLDDDVHVRHPLGSAPRVPPALVAGMAESTRVARTGAGTSFALADAVMIGTMLIWGINISCVKIATDVIAPLGFGLLRYGIAFPVLLLILWRQEGEVRIGRAGIGWLIAGGVCGFGLNQVAFLSEIHLISASLAAIIMATAPLITAVLAATWAREPLRPRALLALILSFAGVLVVIAGAGSALQVSWRGGLCILGAATTLALSAVLVKKPLLHYSSLRVTTWMALFGCLVLMPSGVPALVTTPWSAVTLAIGAAATFTVLGSTVFGNLGWNYAIQHLGAARTSMYTYLQPVVGVVIAGLLLGERLAPVQMLGGLVVLLGLVLYPRRRALGTEVPSAGQDAPRAALSQAPLE